MLWLEKREKPLLLSHCLGGDVTEAGSAPMNQVRARHSISGYAVTASRVLGHISQTTSTVLLASLAWITRFPTDITFDRLSGEFLGIKRPTLSVVPLANVSFPKVARPSLIIYFITDNLALLSVICFHSSAIADCSDFQIRHAANRNFRRGRLTYSIFPNITYSEGRGTA